MNSATLNFISLDLPAILTALFASMCAALVGNFLVLRRMSLLGDTLSHAVLPGIVCAFLIMGSRDSTAIIIGASIAGLLAALLSELVAKIVRSDPGAAMGVVFSTFFALGVLLIEVSSASSVDLDPECLLHGQLEAIFWLPNIDTFSAPIYEWLGDFPSEPIFAFLIFLTISFSIWLFFKELVLASFDSALAYSMGFNPNLINFVLIILVAFAVVASFEAVGSILVIGMLICPAATARLLTDKLKLQILLSQVFAFMSVLIGYFIGAHAPTIFGAPFSVNAAGSMVVVLGILLFCAVVVAPQYGILGRLIRRRKEQQRILEEDLLGKLYRLHELGEIMSIPELNHRYKFQLRDILKKGFIIKSDKIKFTEIGLIEGKKVVESHRRWEAFLVSSVGLKENHVHDSAEAVEHHVDPKVKTLLKEATESIKLDPHGKPIP